MFTVLSAFWAAHTLAVQAWSAMPSVTETSQRPVPSAASVPARGTSADSGPSLLQRWAYGVAWALRPPRYKGVPAMLRMLARHWAGRRPPPGNLPDPERALDEPDGLAGICEDMRVDTLLAAYARGLYPWCHIAPVKWWAPRRRMALLLSDFQMEKNLRRRLRQKQFRFTFDQDFEGVMRGCAEPRPGHWHLTWITPRIRRVYSALYAAGHAHSVEVWDEAGALVGGAYGVAVGRVFFTESQFTRARDASKAAFAVLNCHLQSRGFVLNDGKHHTGYLEQVGFKLMARQDFNRLLARHCATPAKAGRWQVDADLDVANWDPAAARG